MSGFRVRPWWVIFAVLALGAVSVVASQGRHAQHESRGELDFDPNHIVWRWQGPFTYTREFASSAPGCSFHGRETVEATLVCVGPDMGHLQCQANGVAEHAYSENVDAAGSRHQRDDSGSYRGPLRVSFTTNQLKGSSLYNLDVGANVPVRYRNSDGDTARDGQYTLNVAGTTDQQVFSPAAARIEWHRSEPIYEPGPAACAGATYNGTAKTAFRLLPTD